MAASPATPMLRNLFPRRAPRPAAQSPARRSQIVVLTDDEKEMVAFRRRQRVHRETLKAKRIVEARRAEREKQMRFEAEQTARDARAATAKARDAEAKMVKRKAAFAARRAIEELPAPVFDKFPELRHDRLGAHTGVVSRDSFVRLTDAAQREILTANGISAVEAARASRLLSTPRSTLAAQAGAAVRARAERKN